MIILASETISKRRNLPVELQCGKNHIAEKEYIWCVQYAGQGHYFNNLEETAEYIKARKFLTTKQLEKIEGIKKSLLRSADYKLKELQHIEDIRNTSEYRKSTELAEIAEQLMQDRKAQTIVQALKLLEIASLREIKEELSSIDARLESIDIELSEQ